VSADDDPRFDYFAPPDGADGQPDTLGQLTATTRALKDLPARSPRRPALEARVARLREQRLRELSAPAKRKRAS
jgi:hypothetical protein